MYDLATATSRPYTRGAAVLGSCHCSSWLTPSLKTNERKFTAKICGQQNLSKKSNRGRQSTNEAADFSSHARD